MALISALISPRVPRDETGVVTNATILVPVVRGRRDELDGAFAGLTDHHGSVFRHVPPVQTARFEVLDSLPAASTRIATVPLDPPHLLFGVSFDGPFDALVATMCGQVAASIDAVWRCASGYPGRHDPGAVTQWLQRHRVPAMLPFSTQPARADDIRRALATRARFRGFVERAQSMTNADLLAAFRQEFPEDRT